MPVASPLIVTEPPSLALAVISTPSITRRTWFIMASLTSAVVLTNWRGLPPSLIKFMFVLSYHQRTGVPLVEDVPQPLERSASVLFTVAIIT